MASYFDLPPQQKAGAANIDSVPEEQRKELGRMSLLSPAVTQLLDDLGQDRSDSDSEEGSLSEEDTKHLDELTKNHDPQKSRQGKVPNTQPSTNSPLSPNKKSARVKSPPGRTGGGGSTKPKQPHMARFHSLRSMLFSNTIEDKMKNITQEDCAEEEMAANKWKNQHVQRQMHSRPKTPEKDAKGKELGIGTRLKTKLRRMTSKEVPTMETLNEDGAPHDFSDHGSTASSDDNNEPSQWGPREADEESINHSDVEELVRWVSRRDPPSDGEVRTTGKSSVVTETTEDGGHDSIGHSDVDELVDWASRKASGPDTTQDHHTGYSDASTESDSEMIKEQESSDEEDAEDLVRWISHREGPIAGPVRRSRNGDSYSPKAESHVSYDSDVPELGRWIKRHDGTSGESGATSPVHELLEEPERGRPRSRDGPIRPKPKSHLTHEDVDELISWVSRKDSKQMSPPKHDEEAEMLLRQENSKKQQLGMTVDEGSLSHSDVTDLIEHVRSTDLSLQGSDPTVVASSTSAPSPKTDAIETGDLRQLRPSEGDAEKSAAQEDLSASRGGSKAGARRDGEEAEQTQAQLGARRRR